VFKKIGKGNFASVYLAERVEDGKQMAIKAFSKAAVFSEENGKVASPQYQPLGRTSKRDHANEITEQRTHHEAV
jgi:serine/threonine protein kinase